MKALNIENYKELLPYIKDAGYPDYNANIHTMMMWQEEWQIHFETHEHFAFVGFYLHDPYLHYFLPFCKKEYLKEAIDALHDKCSKEGHTCIMHSLDAHAKEYISMHYTNKGYFQYYRDGNAYIYDRKQLETLKGKKMQKRRNHYNAFLKQYDNRFIYEPLQYKHKEEILVCLHEWQENKDNDIYIDDEECGIVFLLDHFNELELYGGCIYIDGKLEAFNIASKLTDTMIQIHIEKANAAIRGLNNAILKHFLETVEDDITLVNLEDDMGLPSLRKAKMDLKPIEIQKKYSFVFDDIEIKHPTDNDIIEMKELWYSRFEDEDKDTTTFYFNEIYKRHNAYIIKNNKEIMGMAFFNPWTMSIHDTFKEIYFLEGVCVKDKYEHCGVMTTLLKYMFEEHKDKEIALQAYNWDLYRPFGFEVTHTLTKTEVSPCYEDLYGDFLPCNDGDILYYLYAQYVDDKDGYRVRDLSYYHHFYIPYAELCDEDIFLYKEKDTILGYIKMYEDDTTIHVSEIIYDNKTVLKHMLGVLNTYEKELIVVHDNDIEIEGTSTSMNALMMLHTKTILHSYVNEIL